ncbi:hypothetical protein [Pseudoalteromonas denitrificans]|uniref:DUF2345 domain-containing protein n=1 Tax=Pseudoalteromonas denitrificans DSM 6059 TaxID=1123010 RepID=A0A1I1NQ71_9GAMM|nr:hypothetical protein [Pseudoalteromonas denitrificans]SFC95890.1 hypothetical protein SAMN02745724_03040 [Pseudoalteromonas denitrificans DSM 6059]
MTDSVTQLIPQTNAKFSTVAAVNELGMITHVYWPDINNQVAIYGQSNAISRCQPGDEVLLQHTSSGFIVSAVLIKQNQVPAADIRDNNGHIELTAQQSITLKTAKGTIEVDAQGSITLEGQEINAHSKQDFNLAGWPIRLN